MSTIEKFIDNGCGFEVVLENVPMVEVRGVVTPDIDCGELHRCVFVALAKKPCGLTIEQIKFYRNYLYEYDVEDDCRLDLSYKWEKVEKADSRDLMLHVFGW